MLWLWALWTVWTKFRGSQSFLQLLRGPVGPFGSVLGNIYAKQEIMGFIYDFRVIQRLYHLIAGKGELGFLLEMLRQHLFFFFGGGAERCLGSFPVFWGCK